MADNPFAQYAPTQPAGTPVPKPANPFAQFAPGTTPPAQEPPANDNPFAQFAPQGWDSRTGFQAHVTDRLMTSVEGLKETGASIVAKSQAEDLATLDKIDELLAPARPQSDLGPVTPSARFDEAMKLAGQSVTPEISEYVKATPERRAEIRAKMQSGVSAGVGGVIEAREARAAIPKNPALVKAIQTGSAWEVFKTVLANPSIITDVALESALQVAAGLVTAPIVGPAAAMGATSLMGEAGQEFTDALAKAGVDVTSREAFEAAMHDPAIVARAKEEALKKGIPVAILDAISGKLASTSIAPASLATQPVKREAANIVMQAPIQAGLGAEGEALGQALQSGGRVTDPAAVMLEAIGEFGGAPVEVLGLGMQRLRSPDVGAPLSEGAIRAMLGGQTNEVAPFTPTPQGPAPAEGPAATGVPGAATAVQAGGEIPIIGGAQSGLSPQAGERLVSAAIKVGEKVYTGPDHGQAFEAAMAAGETPDSISRGDHGGFVTTTGRYVTRAEATAIAQAAAQPARITEGSVTSQGTTTPSAEEVKAAKSVEEKQALFARYGLGLDGRPLPPQDNQPAVPPQVGTNAPQVNVIPGGQSNLFLTAKQSREAVPMRERLGSGDVYTFKPTGSATQGNDRIRSTDGLKTLHITSDAQWNRLLDMVATVAPHNPGVSRGDLIKAIVKKQGFDSLAIFAGSPVGTEALRVNFPGVEKQGRLIVYDNARPAFHVEAPRGAKAKPGVFSTLSSGGVGYLSGMVPGYDPFTHEPNTVIVHGEPVEGYAEVNKLLPFLKEMHKKFFNGARVVLTFTDQGPLARPGARGRFWAAQDGTIVIWLNKNFSTFEQVNTLMHEAGHAVAWWNLWNTDAATQQAIQADYVRYLVRSKGIPSEQAIAETRNATTLAELGSAVDEGGKLILNGQQVDAYMAQMHRWFDFDEWMAEQFARWMSSDRKPFTIVEKWFKSVADKIRNIYRLFGFDPEKSQATAVMTEWLRSVQERNERMDPSNTPTAILHSQLEGKAQVQEELDEDWGEDGPGLSLPTFGLRPLARMAGVPVRNVAAVDKFNWWIDKMWGLLQIAAQNPHIQGLQKYVEAVRAFHISKMANVSRADAHIREWRKLGKNMAANLSNFLFDLDSMSYLRPGENMRWPTNQELIALAQQHGLNADAMALYVKLKDDFSSVLDQMQSAWVRDAQQSIQDPMKLWAALQMIATEMTAMRAKPYFPHERFGEWTATVRDPQGKVVFFQQFAKKRDSQQAEDALRRQFPGHEVYGGRLPEEVAQFRGLPPTLVRSMASRLNLTNAQRRQLDDLLLDLSPANSAAKRFKRRKNTPGYSLDGMRAYAQYFLTMSGHLARLEHSGTMQAAIKEVEASAHAMRGVYIQDAVDKRRGIAEWMQRTFDYMNSSKSEWQGLRSFAFLWYLGYNISSAMVNMTQVPMVALPYLSARFGDFSTMNELRRAYSDIRGTYMMRPGALKPEVQDAVDEAIKQGFIDESMAAELASASSGGTLESMLPGTRVQRGLMNFANIGAIPFRMVEKMNRRVVFLSAFRMAQSAGMATTTAPKVRAYLDELRNTNIELWRELSAKGWTAANADAFIAGRDAVERSQFEYAKWARPEFMRGKKAVLFTFFMFKQNMLWFLKNSPGAGRAWIMLLAGAGIMGLPGADHLDELIKFLAFHIGGKHFSPEQELRKLMQQMDVDPDLAMHGLGYHTLGLSLLGDALGVPVPDVDLSSRIGMERVVPGVNPLLAINRDSWDERFGKSAQEVLGAGLNIPLGILKAVSSQDPDAFKQIERGMPTAWKNFAKAYRWTKDGAETDSNGAVIQDFDVMDSRGRLDIAAQALGFAPTSLAAKRELKAAQYEAMTYWTLRRGELFEQFFFARKANDKEALADVQAAVRAFNQSAPNSALKIGREDLLRSLKLRIKNNRKVELGQAGLRGMTPVFKQLEGLYPGAQPSAPLPPQ